MGDSELVTRHNAFHIIKPEAMTDKKLSAWKSSWQGQRTVQQEGSGLVGGAVAEGVCKERRGRPPSPDLRPALPTS
jgi:hypothetical protein